MLWKYSERSRSVAELVNHYNELGYLESTKSDEEIEDHYAKLPPEEAIAERVKSIPHNIRTGIKILTPNKLLTSLLVLLAQMKAIKNSYKLKHEIKEIL